MAGGRFYVYENWTNTFTKVHRGDCSFCNEGQGNQGRGTRTGSGQWHPDPPDYYPTAAAATAAARRIAAGHPNASVWTVSACSFCC